MCLLI